MSRRTSRFISQAAIIAALYVVLTGLSAVFGLASGSIQLRLSEALCMLACLTPSAVPGLTVGCIVANIVTGCLPWDVVAGSFATLIGAVGTWALREKNEFIAALPPIAANTVIVPLVLRWVYGVPGSLPFLALTVGIGELLSIGVLGVLLLKEIKKRGVNLFNL